MPNDPAHVNGPAFVGLAVRDCARSAEFYEHVLGLRRDPEVFPGGAVGFQTTPIPFGVSPLPPGAGLDEHPSGGMRLWLKANDTRAVYEKLLAAGATIISPPGPGPIGGRFGTQLTFADPDGYAIIVYDRD